MSFRLFVYYCALCGAWAAFIGWLLGEMFAPGQDGDFSNNVIIAMFLGLTIAMGLSAVDALWVLSWRQFDQIGLRVVVSVLIGAVGGLIGGMIGHLLYDTTQASALLVIGWSIVGLLCGVSIGAFEVMSAFIHRKDLRPGTAKLVKCLIGGAVGGVAGAVLVLVFRSWLSALFGQDETGLLFPTAVGFAALGGCIGLLVGLAQVILKEAWIQVEAGFRPGRQMILAKEKTTVGRAEGTDIPLFGDQEVEKLHAQIVQEGSRYFLEDQATPGGTFLNDQRVNGRTPLQTGDRIKLGKSVLRFYERQKRK